MKIGLTFPRLFSVTIISVLFFGSFGTLYATDPGNCPGDLLFLLRLDETTGPNYADFKGTHNGIASVSPTAAPGIVNGAQLFNEDTKINIPDNGEDFEWAAGCSFSLEFWIKTGTHVVPQVGISRQIAGSGITWWLGINEYGGAVMELKDSKGNNYAVYNKDFSISYADNQWHHVVGVKNGETNYMALYVDGDLIEGKTAVFDGNFIAPSPTAVSIGYMLRADGATYEYHVTGALDEAAVFTRALSPSEILTFYNQGAPEGHCSIGNPPEITSTPVTTATEDVAYSYNFTVTDQDVNDVLTLSPVSKPAWLNLNWTPGQKSAILSGTPLNANTGTANVTLRVNDGHSDVDQSFSINVAAVNDAPVISGQNSLAVNEDQSIALIKSDLIITDVDNPAADLSIQVMAGANYTFEDNIITPVENFNGQLSVNVIASDLVSQSETFQVSIMVNPVNDSPVVTSDPILTADVNSAYMYQMTVEDTDQGDVLTISASSLPSWLTLTTGSNSGILMGVPALSDVGSYAIVLKVNDGHEDVMQGFVLTVYGPSGIDDIDKDMLNSVYPNPASSVIHFKPAKTGSARIEIYDITGNVQKSVTFENEDTFEINIADMSNGIYTFKVYQNGNIGSGKFTKN